MMGTEERQAEQIIRQFEEQKERLYRRDGAKRYGEAEHAERLALITAELTRHLGSLIESAEKDAERNEEEALRDSYTDPTSNLTATQAARFAALTPLVREDWERLPIEELRGQLRALASEVSATGSVGAPAALFARYGGFRVRSLEEHLGRAARGEISLTDEVVAQQSAHLRWAGLRGVSSTCGATSLSDIIIVT